MKTVIFKPLTIILFFSLVISHAAEIYIDCSKMKPLPKLFTASIWLDGNQLVTNPADFYMLKKFLKENNPAVIQWSLPLPLFKDSQNFVDFKNRLSKYLNEKPVSHLINEAKKKEICLIVGFASAAMPLWLSSRPHMKQPAVKGRDSWMRIYQMSPPRDYYLWEQVIAYVIKSFLQKGINPSQLGLFIGHEPDWNWLGGEESFFKFYEYAARVVKRIDKRIKVGGMGVSGVYEPKKPCDWKNYTEATSSLCKIEHWDMTSNPFLKDFIHYVAKYRVPLDFINWHSFQRFPFKFKEDVKEVKEWLKSEGLDPSKVKIFIADWTYWGGAYPADYLDTEETAAYFLTALSSMYEAGVNWHGYDFNIRNYFAERENILTRGSTFIGDWPIFTREGIIKPIYNAFKMLTLLTKKKSFLVISKSDDIQIRTLATMDCMKRRLGILITNFRPKGKMKYFYLRYLIKKNLQYHPAAAQIEKTIKVLKEEKKDLFKMTEKELISFLQTSVKMQDQQILTNLQSWIKSYFKRNQKSIQIKLKLVNLPFKGKVNLITYILDNKNSNACKINKLTESISTKYSCGIDGTIDQAILEAKIKAKFLAEEKTKDYLLSLGYNKKEIKKIKRYIKRKLRNKSVLSPQIKNIYQKYIEIYKVAYFSLLEKINQKVSIEKSKQSKIIQIKENKFSFNISMKPNSAILMLFEKREK